MADPNNPAVAQGQGRGRSSGGSAGRRGSFGMAPAKPPVVDPLSDNPEETSRFWNRNPQQRFGSNAADRAGAVPGYVPGYGRQSAQNERSSLTGAGDWANQFTNRITGQVGPTPSGAPIGAPHVDPLASALTGPGSILPNGARDTGSLGSNVAGSNAAGEEFPAGHPFMPSTAPVHIPAPVTGPGGTPSTGASNLAQNMAMYAPGGMSPKASQMDPYSPAPYTTTAGTGAAGAQSQINSPYGVAYSTAGQAPGGNHYIGDETGDRTAQFAQQPQGPPKKPSPKLAGNDATPQVDPLA